MTDDSLLNQKYKTVIRPVLVSAIKPAPFNPKRRITTAAGMSKMVESVAKFGILKAPEVVFDPSDNMYMLIDGHRRFDAWKRLEKKYIRVSVYVNATVQDAPSIWAGGNGPIRRHSSLEWMEFWYMSGCGQDPEVQVPSVVMKNIKACKRIFGGNNGIKYLCDNGVSPAVCVLIEKLHFRLHDAASLKPVISEKQIGVWMIDNSCQEVVQHICRLPKPTYTVLKKLHKAIRTNIPLDMGMLY